MLAVSYSLVHQQFGPAAGCSPMRFVSIDLETTGGDPWRHEIIEFAAIIYNTRQPVARDDAPSFRVLMQPTFAYAQSAALRMNQKLIEELQAPDFDTIVVTEAALVDQFAAFLLQHGFVKHERGRIRIQAAGKNFDKFDRIFLERLPLFRQQISLHRAALDPGLLFWNPKKDKQWIPSLSTCKKRIGLADPTVAHRGLDDAWDVVQLVQYYADHWTALSE